MTQEQAGKAKCSQLNTGFHGWAYERQPCARVSPRVWTIDQAAAERNACIATHTLMTQWRRQLPWDDTGVRDCLNGDQVNVKLCRFHVVEGVFSVGERVFSC